MEQSRVRRREQVQKILIIDDDPSGSRLLATLLELEGYQPLQLVDWKDPVGEVERHQPSVIIMDVHLWNRSGFDVLRELRSHPEASVAGTPVLMISAEDCHFQSSQAGANAFLAKPFELAALLDNIKKIQEESLSDN
jgi:DNA-binding response OmpR family regulator